LVQGSFFPRPTRSISRGPRRPPKEDAAREAARKSRLDEARRLWRKVLTFDSDDVSPADRAASYFGLLQ